MTITVRLERLIALLDRLALAIGRLRIRLEAIERREEKP